MAIGSLFDSVVVYFMISDLKICGGSILVSKELLFEHLHLFVKDFILELRKICWNADFLSDLFSVPRTGNTTTTIYMNIYIYLYIIYIYTCNITYI